MTNFPENSKDAFLIKLLGTRTPVCDDVLNDKWHYEYEFEGKRYNFNESFTYDRKECDSLNSMET